MIISKLEGGLGNQMFQYAMGRLLAKRNHQRLLLDHSYFWHLSTDPKITTYVYALGVFPRIKERAATFFDYFLLLPMMVPLLAYRWEQIYKLFHLGSFHILHEKSGLTFDQTVLKQRGNVFVQGFWQHYRYPALIEKELKEMFTFAPEISTAVEKKLAGIPHSQRISVHVRRGDYLGIGLGVCSLEYYKKAANLIEKKVRKPHFIVVSNDIKWSRQHLKFLKHALYIDPKAGSEAHDLCTISMCAHNIIANSSFSWWGAWLNPNPKKIVIAPKPWFDWDVFADKTPVPPEWKLLKK